MESLSRRSLLRGVSDLTARDPDLAAVVARHGPPPLWGRQPGFATLVRIILEQQVSLASARSAFGRLRLELGSVTPHAVASAGEARLRNAGLTRQKAAYCAALARAVVEGNLDLSALARRSDDDIAAALQEHPGIGPWTTDIYLLMALRRPDVWPRGDLALAKAAQRVKRLRRLPDPGRLAALAERWAPWRAVAARILWHEYLSSRSAGGTLPGGAPGQPCADLTRAPSSMPNVGRQKRTRLEDAAPDSGSLRRR